MNNQEHRIYLMTANNDLYIQLLKKELEKNQFQRTENRSEATIVLGDPPLVADHLDHFTQLKWLQSTFAGIDSLVKPGLRQDYQLTNVKGPFGQLISEYVLGYTLSYTRHFNQYKEQQNHKQWQPHSYQNLKDKNLVILGTGTIAREVASKLSVMGLNMLGINTSGIPPKDSPFSQVFHIRELDAALSKADIIVNTLPHTQETRHILNSDAFSACKHALLFNVGRGGAVAETDLLNALESNQIAHAFLDVFEQEPLPAEHPFWSNSKITVTPHIAAVSFPEQVATVFAKNLALWQQEKPLNYLVDFNKGY
ncbi:D-2-hydroxyacid dehydrogenase [Vibrio salinus]|uniref:D-2-hydroxyacid dehydrogenase n=1 Tax=Vibrio salinus TaxID=2899784 RepID=UPI001E28EEB0|nr:D-2-hydroxyacid dehydrogenase [Vibrio salinus]MCE0493813.1 D-2-hydroxyacid dehydrogenase [Vibrio salinus]